MKLALISSFYEKSKRFHQECLKSIANQTDTNFVAILFGDNFNLELLNHKLGCQVEYEFVTNLTPREIKALGIQKALNLGCDYICFIDSDDFMSEQRINFYKKMINVKKFDILIHNLTTIRSDSSIIKNNALKLRSGYYKKEFFYKKNISGFGNTLYKTDLLKMLLPFPDNSLSLDWEVISVLSFSSKIYSLDKSLTFYRQHDDNEIGLYKKWNKERLDIRIKSRDLHYSYLRSFFPKSSTINKLEENWKKKKSIIIKNKKNYLKKLTNYKNLYWQELI